MTSTAPAYTVNYTLGEETRTSGEFTPTSNPPEKAGTLKGRKFRLVAIGSLLLLTSLNLTQMVAGGYFLRLSHFIMGSVNLAACGLAYSYCIKPIRSTAKQEEEDRLLPIVVASPSNAVPTLPSAALNTTSGLVYGCEERTRDGTPGDEQPRKAASSQALPAQAGRVASFWNWFFPAKGENHEVKGAEKT